MRPCSALGDSDPVDVLDLLRWRLEHGLVQEDLLGFEVAELRRCHLRSLEGVVLEKAFFDPPVGEFHPAYTVLDPAKPLTLVAGSVLPEHLTIAMALIVLVAASVEVSAFPGEAAHPVLLVVLVRALVRVAVLVVESLLPLSFPVLKAVLELSSVDAGVLPLVLALSFGLAHDVLASVAVSIGEDVRALAVL